MLINIMFWCIEQTAMNYPFGLIDHSTYSIHTIFNKKNNNCIYPVPLYLFHFNSILFIQNNLRNLQEQGEQEGAPHRSGQVMD